MEILKRYWSKLFFVLSEGRAADYESLDAMDVFDFFRMKQVWEESMEQKIEKIKGKTGHLSGNRSKI